MNFAPNKFWRFSNRWSPTAGTGTRIRNAELPSIYRKCPHSLWERVASDSFNRQFRLSALCDGCEAGPRQPGFRFETSCSCKRQSLEVVVEKAESSINPEGTKAFQAFRGQLLAYGISSTFLDSRHKKDREDRKCVEITISLDGQTEVKTDGFATVWIRKMRHAYSFSWWAHVSYGVGLSGNTSATKTAFWCRADGAER